MIAIADRMKVLSAIFILAISTSLHAQDVRDSVDEVAFKRQIQRLHDDAPGIIFFDKQEHKIWQEKMSVKGSWKFSFEEWQMLFRGDLLPEYYYDEELKASNGGFCIA